MKKSMALSCSRNIIHIITWNNFETHGRFLLPGLIELLDFYQYMKSDKMLYIIYSDIETLIKKIDICANNPENYSATKLGEHIHCRYSMSTIWAFDNTENKHTLYRGKNCMKKIWTYSREHVTNVINFEKNKKLPSTKK